MTADPLHVASGTSSKQASPVPSYPNPEFNGHPPTICLAITYSVPYRDDLQLIRTNLADQLRPWLPSRPTGQPVFGALTKHTNLLIQSDLARADIPYRGD